MKAQDFLQAGIGHMQDRAATYDKPTGERSMAATVGAFKCVSGVEMTEEQGWLFMGLLKMVRSQQGEFKADNYEDEAAYAALRGECAFAARSCDTASPVTLADRIEAFNKASAANVKAALDSIGASCAESAAQFMNTIPVADADGRIKWDGGECPVDDGDDVSVKFQGGKVRRDKYPEGWNGWGVHCPEPEYKIIAYRIHKAGE